MKTFEEAFTKVTDKKDYAKLVANLRETESHISNEKWKEMIQEFAVKTMEEMMLEPKKMLTSLCVTLHTVWTLGQLTGQEMEKEELEEFKE